MVVPLRALQGCSARFAARRALSAHRGLPLAARSVHGGLALSSVLRLPSLDHVGCVPRVDAHEVGRQVIRAPVHAAPAPPDEAAAAPPSPASFWRLMLAEVGKDLALFAGAIVSSIVAALAGVRAAQHIGTTFDIMAEGGISSEALAPAVVALVGVYAVRAVLTFVSSTLLSMGVNRIAGRLQTEMVRALLEQDICFFDSAEVGTIAALVTADVKESTAALKHVLQNGLQMVTAVAGGAFSLWALSRRLSAVMLMAIPVTTLVFRQFGIYVRALSRKEREASAQASAVVNESVAKIRTVQSFVAEGLEAERFAREVNSAMSLRHSLGMLRGAFFGLLGFALQGVTALVVAAGGSLVARGEMSHGDVSAFLAQTREVIQAVSGLTRLADEVRDGVAAGNRVSDLIASEPSVLPRGSEAPSPEPTGAVLGRVELRAVSFAYPQRPDMPVLRGVDLVLEAGKVTALVGDSGSGKSTVAWLVERFYDPTEGSISLDGRPLGDYDVRWLRRHIGLVSQEPVLFAGTIADNIRYGRPDATDVEVALAADRANAGAFIRAFPEGFGKALGPGGAGLSGGQKQRVAIARALIKAPPILIFDEATSALDAQSERMIIDALDGGLLKGRTTLIIAHRLSSVRRADKIAVLQKGRVVEEGTHAELIAKGGVYASLVRLQMEGGVEAAAGGSE